MVKYKKDKTLEFKPKERILKLLIENKEPQTILSISGASCVDYKNAYNIVNDLQASMAIVKEIAVGNAKPVRLNLSLNQDILNVESKRTEEFLLKNP